MPRFQVAFVDTTPNPDLPFTFFIVSVRYICLKSGANVYLPMS
jgi:hypothetical protein